LSISGDDPLTFKGLSIVQAQCVTTGLPDAPEAIYLVELTDQRGVISNRFFEFPTNSYYNVLSPAYPANYYSASLNGGSAWTWNGMIGNMLWTGEVTGIAATAETTIQVIEV
jgi:hypothetical protein